MSFRERILKSIREDKKSIKTLTEGLEWGCFRILTECQGYTHFHFFQDDPPFSCSTYFELLKMISENDRLIKKAQKKKNKRGKKG